MGITEMTTAEVDTVSGGITAGEAIGATAGLMAVCAGSAIVVGVGIAAIAGHLIIEHVTHSSQ